MNNIYGIYKYGQLKYIGLHEDATACWFIYLGFPDADEIKKHKAAGFACYKINISSLHRVLADV